MAPPPGPRRSRRGPRRLGRLRKIASTERRQLGGIILVLDCGHRIELLEPLDEARARAFKWRLCRECPLPE